MDVERGTWNGRSWKRLRGTPNSAPKKEETYPAENLFYCHYYLLFYCPKAFRTEAEKSGITKKSTRILKKNTNDPHSSPLNSNEGTGARPRKRQPARKRARPATLIEANQPAAMTRERKLRGWMKGEEKRCR